MDEKDKDFLLARQEARINEGIEAWLQGQRRRDRMVKISLLVGSGLVIGLVALAILLSHV